MPFDQDHIHEVPEPAARHATGIPSDRMYRIAEPLRWMLDQVELSDAEIRLLHVLLHATCRRTDDWYRGTALQPDAGYRASCMDLRRRLGLEASNSNRVIRDTLPRLAATGLFQEIRLAHRNRKLVWRFADDTFAALFSDSDYGLLDIAALATLKSRFDLDLWVHLAIVRRMNAPRIAFPLEDLYALRDSQGALAWSDLRKPFLGALHKIAALHEMQVVLLLDWEGRLPGIDRVLLRLRHAGTSWRYEALGKTYLDTVRVIVLDATMRAELKPEALPGALQALRKVRWDLARALPDAAKPVSVRDHTAPDRGASSTGSA
jgi:hypothetical protein